MENRKEIAGYIFFGVLTTVLNIVIYALLAKVLAVDYKSATTAAWIISVLFAFFTNKLLVFNSKSTGLKIISKELGYFLLCRLFSYGLDILTMVVFIDVLSINDLGAKITANFFVIVFNYLGSKFLVFRQLIRSENN